MSRPKGSLNKPKPIEVIQQPNPPAEVKVFQQVRYDLQLAIRAFRDGQWKGLWELSKVDNNGKRTIVIDATSRQSIINMVNKQIMQMVIV